MSLLVEDGSGVTGAEAYASDAAAAAYWAKRPQSPLAATWTAETDQTKREGALREATDYLDAELGQSYPGDPKTTTQGKLCPRAKDCGDAFNGFPAQLVAACIELAARALTAPLAADTDSNGWVKRVRERVEGVVDTETEYGAAGPMDGQYGAVFRSLAFWLGGTPGLTWSWA